MFYISETKVLYSDTFMPCYRERKAPM